MSLRFTSLKKAHFNLQELSGAFGDLGTFIPLLLGLVTFCHIPFVESLFMTGIYHLLTACVYPIPLPVQPMKAIAAEAITQGSSPETVVWAGLFTGITVAVLALSGLLRWLHKAIPMGVLRGLQLAIGLKLALKGMDLIAWEKLSLPIGLAVAGAIFLVFFSFFRAFPSALLIFLMGTLFALPAVSFSFSFAFPHLHLPLSGPPGESIRLAIGQFPLTVLNSVILVVVFAKDLFPAEEIKVETVAATVGIMNLLGFFFQAMPCCHGSGGLASQYRFGARTNGSMMILGGIKIVGALFFGSFLLEVIHAFPKSFLGILLFFSGLELALPARKIQEKMDFLVLLVTTATILRYGILWGVLAGWILGLVITLKVFRQEG